MNMDVPLWLKPNGNRVRQIPCALPRWVPSPSHLTATIANGDGKNLLLHRTTRGEEDINAGTKTE